MSGIVVMMFWCRKNCSDRFWKKNILCHFIYTLYECVWFDIRLSLGTRPPLPQGQTTDAGWKVSKSDEGARYTKKSPYRTRLAECDTAPSSAELFELLPQPIKIVRWQKRARKTKQMYNRWGAQHQRLCKSDLSTSVCVLVVGLVTVFSYL